MRILHFTALALLAGFAYATPIPSHALLRNSTTNSLPGIIPTSTDSTASAVSDLPTFGTCRAFYYDPKDDVPCGVVARQFTIFLTYPEYDQPSTAQWCEVFLNGNGICRATSPNSPSAFPTSKPSTLSISTVAPTTENAASANPSASAPANASTSALCATTSSFNAAGSPVAAIVFANGSIVSIGSAAATARTETSSRDPVVLASVRASEYSATVIRTSSSVPVTSTEGLAPSNALITGGTSTPAASTFRFAINATRTIGYNMGHGNATSLRTVLVTAHVAVHASTMAPAIASGGVALGSNLTLAVRGIRARRQASSFASSMNATSANILSGTTYQVVNAEPTTSPEPQELLGLAAASSLLTPTATNQPASLDISLSSIALAGAPLPEPTSYVESDAYGSWAASSVTPGTAELASQADFTSSFSIPDIEAAPSSNILGAAVTTASSTTSTELAVVSASATLPEVAQPSSEIVASSPFTATEDAAGACLPAPGPTPPASATSCGRWHVVAAGDTCNQVAAQHNTDLAAFLSLNPTLDSDCKFLWQDFAYCVAPCDETLTSPASTPSSYTTGSDEYISYHGDGTSEQGWPQMSDWMTWDDLAAANRDGLASACTYWEVKENSPEEVDSLLAIVLRVAEESELDPRVLLAMTLQESHGCLRVPSTMGAHKNPGILQSHMGNGTCNTNTINAGDPGPMQDDSLVWETCPESQIETMVRDGALGTPAGDGILQLLDKEQNGGYGDAQMWYRVARGYNSGSVDPSNVLELGAATHAYASDIANRLTGWNTGPSPFA